MIKAIAYVTVRLEFDVTSETPLNQEHSVIEAIQEMDYNFTSQSPYPPILNTEISSFEIATIKPAL